MKNSILLNILIRLFQVPLYSLCVKTCSEYDVPFNRRRSFLHLLIEDWITYDSGSVTNVSQNLIKSLNTTNNDAFLHVCQIGYLGEGLKR